MSQSSKYKINLMSILINAFPFINSLLIIFMAAKKLYLIYYILMKVYLKNQILFLVLHNILIFKIS